MIRNVDDELFMTFPSVEARRVGQHPAAEGGKMDQSTLVDMLAIFRLSGQPKNGKLHSIRGN
jgi:hypothetical protein